MPETQGIQITCPSCGNVYQAPVRSIIDVGVEPRLRDALLTGVLNVAVCPKCRTALTVETPLVYHDPDAQFLGVYFPPQLNIPEVQKQKMIGELTQSLMRSVPPDQRKGYFFSPRQFTSRQSLMDAVLGTMGISQETLDRQRKKAKLVEQFAVMADDPKGLRMLLKGNESQVDGEFYSILSSMLEHARTIGDQKMVERLQLLEQNLLPLTPFGQRLAKQREAVASLEKLDSPEAFFERVVKADLDEAEAIAAVARPLMDYSFFEQLTGRIDAAQGPERDRLLALREKLLQVTDRVDQATQAVVRDKLALLGELINDPSPRSAVRAYAEEIDDLFLAILRPSIQKAKDEGDQELASVLEMIRDEALQIIHESLPPEIQFINELITQPYPAGTRQMLREHRDEVTPEVLDIMARMAEDLGQAGDPASAELAKRIRDIRAQALLLV